MIGITEINKEVNKKTRVGEAEVKTVIATFLEVIKQNLIKGEDVSFKGYFTLKRSKQLPKISKFCDRHTKEMNEFKKNNKGKELTSFVKSPVFKKLSSGIKKCDNCQAQKQKIAKGAKLLPRVVCKTSEGL